MTKIAEENVTDPARVQDCLSNILSTSDFLLELVNNVLDMSKLEAGEAETEHEPFDLRDVLQSAETVISAQVADCGIAFTADTPEGTHWRLRGSPLNIQRVLQNIMSNAVKYNRPGGSVHVSCRETACENGTATFVFTCAGSGIGMSREFQVRAFDTFAQGHKTSRTTYSGSGLSLAIAKKTVELLGGNISFVSREGEGTTFTVTLPLTVDTSYRPPAPEPEAGARLDGIRILMAEDNALNREIATYMLEERGALVTAAEDGQKAVDCFIAAAPGSFDGHPHGHHDARARRTRRGPRHPCDRPRGRRDRPHSRRLGQRLCRRYRRKPGSGYERSPLQAPRLRSRCRRHRAVCPP